VDSSGGSSTHGDDPLPAQRDIDNLVLGREVRAVAAILVGVVPKLMRDSFGDGWLDMARNRVDPKRHLHQNDPYFLLKVVVEFPGVFAPREQRERANARLLLKARNVFAHVAPMAPEFLDEVREELGRLKRDLESLGVGGATPDRPETMRRHWLPEQVQATPLEAVTLGDPAQPWSWSAWDTGVTAPHLVAYGPSGMDLARVVSALLEAALWHPPPFERSEVIETLRRALDPVLKELRISVTEESATWVGLDVGNPLIMSFNFEDFERVAVNNAEPFGDGRTAELPIQLPDRPVLAPNGSAGWRHLAGCDRLAGALWYLKDDDRSPDANSYAPTLPMAMLLADGDPVTALVNQFTRELANDPTQIGHLRRERLAREQAEQMHREFWERYPPEVSDAGFTARALWRSIDAGISVSWGNMDGVLLAETEQEDNVWADIFSVEIIRPELDDPLQFPDQSAPIRDGELSADGEEPF
jgi:hypothetical protein